MGTFRIEITAVGGHGLDRDKKDGEIVDFKKEGEYSPEALTLKAIAEMKHFGINVQEAKIVHWSGEVKTIEDDLLTGKRTGNF